MANRKYMSRYIRLFLTFFKIGAFTFGGGYAMIPLIQREVVENKKWISDEDILEMVAIAESTPGPIAVNMATFVGYKIGGFVGAMAATLGVVVPSFFIILLVSVAMDVFSSSKIIQDAFRGVRVGVLALIIKVLWSMLSKCDKSIVVFLVIIITFVLVAFFGANVFVVLLACAIFGLVQSILAERKLK